MNTPSLIMRPLHLIPGILILGLFSLACGRVDQVTTENGSAAPLNCVPGNGLFFFNHDTAATATLTGSPDTGYTVYTLAQFFFQAPYQEPQGLGADVIMYDCCEGPDFARLRLNQDGTLGAAEGGRYVAPGTAMSPVMPFWANRQIWYEPASGTLTLTEENAFGTAPPFTVLDQQTIPGFSKVSAADGAGDVILMAWNGLTKLFNVGVDDKLHLVATFAWSVAGAWVDTVVYLPNGLVFVYGQGAAVVSRVDPTTHHITDLVSYPPNTFLDPAGLGWFNVTAVSPNLLFFYSHDQVDMTPRMTAAAAAAVDNTTGALSMANFAPGVFSLWASVTTAGDQYRCGHFWAAATPGRWACAWRATRRRELEPVTPPWWAHIQRRQQASSHGRGADRPIAVSHRNGFYSL
jgi:hypothetical protein